MEKFQGFGLPNTVLQSLQKMGFLAPTSIQVQTIPVVLNDQNVLATAQTGTGKTGAFAIPLASQMLTTENKSVLVLTPTRELATQVISIFHQLLSMDRSVKTALLIGGEAIERQFKQLKARPRLIVGTPGRINDHLKRGTLRLNTVNTLVLDEMDLMLDMGFDVQIARIIKTMPVERQTLMFSATLPKAIEGLAGKYLDNPARLSAGSQSVPPKNIDQDILVVSEQDKYPQLLKQLEHRHGSILVFVKTKRGADRLSAKLNSSKPQSEAIHGDLRQSKRERVLRAFRKEKFRIMVATDVAARGIDIPHIRHVINYDLPQCPQDYIHRIGRTARAGEKGSAISLMTKGDQKKWQAIEGLLNPYTKHKAEFSNARKKKSSPHSKAKKRFVPQRFKKNTKRQRPAA